jgi:hypothetical protein
MGYTYCAACDRPVHDCVCQKFVGRDAVENHVPWCAARRRAARFDPEKCTCDAKEKK